MLDAGDIEMQDMQGVHNLKGQKDSSEEKNTARCYCSTMLAQRKDTWKGKRKSRQGEFSEDIKKTRTKALLHERNVHGKMCTG